MLVIRIFYFMRLIILFTENKQVYYLQKEKSHLSSRSNMLSDAILQFNLLP